MDQQLRNGGHHERAKAGDQLDRAGRATGRLVRTEPVPQPPAGLPNLTSIMNLTTNRICFCLKYKKHSSKQQFKCFLFPLSKITDLQDDSLDASSAQSDNVSIEQGGLNKKNYSLAVITLGSLATKAEQHLNKEDDHC